MDPIKEEWLKSIGAIIQPWEHCKYYVPSTKMHYSEEYIEKPRWQNCRRGMKRI